MLKYTVDDKINIPAKIVEGVENEDGKFYRVKFTANNKTNIVQIEENEIVESGNGG